MEVDGSEADESSAIADTLRVTHHILDAIRNVEVTFVMRLIEIKASPNRVIVRRKMDCPAWATAMETAEPRPEAAEIHVSGG